MIFFSRWTCWILLIKSFTAFSHNGDELDSLLAQKVIEYGIHTIRVNHLTDTTQLHEMSIYNRKGERTTLLLPRGGSAQIDKRVFRYDDEGRKTAYLRYDLKDTSRVIFDQTYKFTATEGKVEYKVYSMHELRSTKTIIPRESTDTLWITELEESAQTGKIEKTVTRRINYADTLYVTECINYDANDHGLITEIKAHYTKIELNDGIKTVRKGECHLGGQAVHELSNDEEAILEFYVNPNKFFKAQLAGKYGYELATQYSMQQYDSDGRLIRNGSDPSLPTTSYVYNEKNQLEKAIKEGRDWQSTSKERVQLSTVHFEYDERGLPLKMEERDKKGEIKSTYTFDYSFY